MILVIEHASDLLPLPPEPQHCSLEQALRNMDWPFPAATAAAAMPTRMPVRMPARPLARTPVAAVRPVAPEPQPMLDFAAAY